MSEQHFREIQLSGKQLVFLFMTSVVVAVGVFLLGVSVGRGVREHTGGAMDTAEGAASVAPPVDLPPPTELSPADTAYHNSLQGSRTPAAEPEPISEPVADDAADTPAEAPAVVEAPAPAPRPAAPAPQPRPAPVSRPASAPTSSTASASTAKPAPAAASGWFLQVGAYRSRPNADRQARELTAKGYPAAVASDAAGELFRVRIGPFADRPEAVRAQTRLRTEEGQASSVTR